MDCESVSQGWDESNEYEDVMEGCSFAFPASIPPDNSILIFPCYVLKREYKTQAWPTGNNQQ